MIQTYIDIPASVKAARGEQNACGAVKTKEDLERYERIIALTHPDLIIECGTWKGFSALWFARRVSQVISIDTDDALSPEVADAPMASFVTFIRGSSVNPDIAHQVHKLAAGKRVMVVLDSDHRAEHVVGEIRLYGPLVTPGCYLVVEEGIAEWMDDEPYKGPIHAIESELADDLSWRRDVAIEQLSPISMHPAGWWEKL